MFSSRASFVVRLLAAALLIALAPATWSQETTPAQATDEAFDALLSLPQGLPEGSEFASGLGDRIKDQAALRAALEEDLSAGADVNAYRHGGTLLLHALRANLQDTALWLLANGADPRLEVDDGQVRARARATTRCSWPSSTGAGAWWMPCCAGPPSRRARRATSRSAGSPCSTRAPLAEPRTPPRASWRVASPDPPAGTAAACWRPRRTSCCSPCC